MRNNLKKIIAVLLLLPLLTSCTSGGGDSTSSGVPDSSVPASSDIPVSSEPTKPALSLTTKSAWNHYTVCDFAYIDTNNVVHISPDFKAYASAAKKYDGKSDAVSVVCMNDTYVQELWILWKDGTVSYIHPTIKEVAKIYPAKDENGKLKEDPTDYEPFEPVGAVLYPGQLESHWAKVETSLQGKNAAWIFGDPFDFYEGEYYYGFVEQNGTIHYYDAEGASFAGDAEDPYVYADGTTWVTKAGKACSVFYLPSENRYQVTELVGEGAVQAVSTGEYSICLMRDGSVKHIGEGTAANKSAKVYKLFAGTKWMERLDGTIISWYGEKELSMIKDAPVDQIVNDMILFDDGTVTEEFMPENWWMNGVTNVKVLNK